ncbi:MAG: type I 3-dehydroquinate dehydratase [Clostridiales bacterium]|nr:type I 3-dehydroquinate dehydratase [Clostridiales bacterium]
MKRLEIKGKTFGIGRPLLCVAVMERTKEEIIREIAFLAESRADIIEWRVDAFEKANDCNAIREILHAVAPYFEKKLFLYTFRTKKQGGEAEADAEMMMDIHDLATESGCVDLLDLEFLEEEHAFREIRRLHKKGVAIVASHHDFDGTPSLEVMKMLLEKMCEGGADLVKLAVMPHTREDVRNLLTVTAQFAEENPDVPIITMSMGSMGSISRLCGETFGSCVTFGAHKRASAPGQFEMNCLLDILELLHESEARERG